MENEVFKIYYGSNHLFNEFYLITSCFKVVNKQNLLQYFIEYHVLSNEKYKNMSVEITDIVENITKLAPELDPLKFGSDEAYRQGKYAIDSYKFKKNRCFLDNNLTEVNLLSVLFAYNQNKVKNLEKVLLTKSPEFNEFLSNFIYKDKNYIENNYKEKIQSFLTVTFSLGIGFLLNYFLLNNSRPGGFIIGILLFLIISIIMSVKNKKNIPENLQTEVPKNNIK